MSSPRGANADYQRALDAYEAAKHAADQLTEPEQVRHVTEILEDGRYAMACVRSRVDGRRSRRAGPRASSTRGTACRWPTWPTRLPAVPSATYPRASSMPSVSGPVPSPTSAR